MYYKLIKDKTVVGVASSYDMRRYQKKHNLILACTEDFAEYIECEGVLYHTDWMSPIITESVEFANADIYRIEKDEYDALNKAIDSGEDVTIEDEVQPEPEPEEVDPVVEVTVEYVREKKLREVSNACSSAIVGGFDIALSDGATHHFSLSVQDQMNMNLLVDMVKAGADSVPYHADGEIEKNYIPDDIYAICNAATKHRFYHVSYHNSLKNYVNTLDSIEEISAVEYGMEIPSECKNSSFKDIVSGNTSFNVYNAESIYKDDAGNKYSVSINTDGAMQANIIESAGGELFI